MRFLGRYIRMGKAASTVHSLAKPQDLAPRTQTTFDAIRLLAAFGVLVSHHFLVAGRPQPSLGSYGELGPLCVFVFFAISGYFIAGSWSGDPDITRYWTKRGLRILPALFVTVVLTVFVIGPIATALETSEYFADSRTWRYLRNALLVFGIEYDLPGVFVGRLSSYVNLSLWSLPVELAMYAVLSIAAFYLPSRTRLAFPVLAVVSGLLWYVSPDPRGYALSNAFGLGATFFTGATIHAYGLLPRMTSAVALSAAGVLALGAFLTVEIGRPILWAALPILVLGFGSRPSRLGAAVARRGDISYGVYLWAFPIQQVFVGTGGFFVSMVLAIMVTALAGLLSMRLIEGPALAMRPGTGPRGGEAIPPQTPSKAA